MARRVALLGLLLLPLALGCGAAVDVVGVPADPIAFVRQEPAKGVMGLDEFRQALRFPNPDEPETLRARRTTTVALLSVPSGELTNVPDAGEGSFAFDWSHDGVRLLIGRADQGRRTIELNVWNRLTGAWDRPRPTLSAGPAALAEGPVRIAAIGRQSRPDAPAELGIVVYLDRFGLRELVGATPGRDPDVAPDGVTVVYVRPSRAKSRESTIVSTQLDTGETRVLGRGDHPRFSRDGRWIAFERRRDRSSDVWLMRANGTGKRALTNTGAYDEEYPALSPDGSYVVYATTRSELDESQLYLKEIATGRELQLTRTGQNSRPVW